MRCPRSQTGRSEFKTSVRMTPDLEYRQRPLLKATSVRTISSDLLDIGVPVHSAVIWHTVKA